MPIPRPAPEQRRWWIFGTIAITLAVAVTVWFGISASSGISWQDTGRTTVDDRTVRVRFDVIDPENGPVTCTLVALAPDKSIVGRRTVALPASRFESTRHVVEVKTTQRAVATTVESCQRTPTDTPGVTPRS